MTSKESRMGWSRDEMAARLAQDIANGSYVNLGIGIPELVAKYVPEGRTFIYHTENGLIGMGPSPAAGQGDPELINAGKRQVTAMPGAAYFHHADSFVMIRGGHIDLCVLGALQVAQETSGVGRGLCLEDTDEDPAGRTVDGDEQGAARRFISHLR